MSSRGPVLWAALIAVLAAGGGCTTSVEPSPRAGTVRVLLKSGGADTTLVILSDTVHFSRYDAFDAVATNGKLYHGDNYAPLYVDPTLDRPEGSTINLLGREWLNGTPITIRDSLPITPSNSRYRQYTVFETYVPPGTYDRLEFTLVAGEIATYIPKFYVNPVQLPPDAAPQLAFPVSLTVQEDKVTEVVVTIAPFRSLRRYQDLFLFDRVMRIASIQTR